MAALVVAAPVAQAQLATFTSRNLEIRYGGTTRGGTAVGPTSQSADLYIEGGSHSGVNRYSHLTFENWRISDGWYDAFGRIDAVLDATPADSAGMVVTDDVFFSVQAPATAYINFGTGFSGHPTQSAGQYADLFAQAGGALSGPSVVNGACRSSTSGPGRKVVGLLPGNYHLNLYTFLASSSGGWQAGDFSEVTISMILAPRLPDCPADVGGIGGFAVSDGLLDNNDFIAFIGLFFSLNRQADRGSTGGDAWPDGLFDNNDFIVFIDQFFLAC